MSIYYSDDQVTLYHGDCRELIGWLEADVLITDPPYGIPGGRTGQHSAGRAVVDAHWDDLTVRDEALALWGDRPAAVFGSPRRIADAPTFTQHPLVWDKGNMPAMGRLDFPWRLTFEFIYITGDGWGGSRGEGVLRHGHSTSAAATVGHPTPKPVALMEDLISHAPSGLVADPFAGSGSTLVAARNLGRKAIGVELDERYCEIIAKRLSQGAFDFGAVV